MTPRKIGYGLALVLPLIVVAALLAGGERRPDETGAAAFVPDATAVNDCRSIAEAGGDPVPCYRQALANLALLEGTATALATFREEMARSVQLAGGCHPVAHLIGAAGLTRAKGDVGEAFVSGDETCASGYYHGVLEHAFSDVPGDAESLWSIAGPLCRSPKIESVAYLAEQCYHGIGHGLMLANDYRLPVATDVCGRFEVAAANACFLGAFMENFAASYGFASSWVNDDDLGLVCAGLSGPRSEIAKGACYNTITYRIAERSRRTAPWSEYIEICSAIDPTYASACFNGFGREVYTRYAGAFADSFTAMHDACLTAPAAGARVCLMSVAGHASYTYGGGSEAAGFCAALDGADRVACFGEIGAFLATLEGGAGALAGRCEAVTAPGADRDACMKVNEAN